jgi:vancomycin resistance protein YoaR
MKKRKYIISTAILAVLLCTVVSVISLKAATTQSVPEDKFCSGIFVEDMDLSNMTLEEARESITAYIDDLKNKSVTVVVDGENIEISVNELGLECTNENIIEEAFNFGKTGNLIKRYKELKDLENEPVVYELEFTLDEAAANSVLAEKCAEYETPAQNATLTRENGKFVVTEEQRGRKIDYEASVQLLNEFILNEWDHEDGASIELSVVVDEPQYTKEQLAKVQDVLGTFTTSYADSNSNRSTNVANGAKLINGTILYPGEEFSAYEKCSPFTSANGYRAAGAYENGKVIDSIGGGICQVSTTLYNAVIRAELEITERHPHSMIVGYVQLSADAAIAGTYKDLKFKNNTDTPIYIEAYTEGKKITFTIYGQETRPEGRTIDFKQETLKVIPAGAEVVTEDPNLPAGTRKVTQSAHTGYVAVLYKYVYQDGKLVSKEQFNKSSYSASPAYVTVGTGGAEDPSVPTYADPYVEPMAPTTTPDTTTPDTAFPNTGTTGDSSSGDTQTGDVTQSGTGGTGQSDSTGQSEEGSTGVLP